MTTIYNFIGDTDTGLFYDMKTINDGYCSAYKVTSLSSAIGFDGAYLIERGSIPIIERHRKAALDCCGYTEADIKENPHLLPEAFDSYMGIEEDSYNGRYTIQTLADGAMEFEGWEADKRVVTDSPIEWLKEQYNIITE